MQYSVVRQKRWPIPVPCLPMYDGVVGFSHQTIAPPIIDDADHGSNTSFAWLQSSYMK